VNQGLEKIFSVKPKTKQQRASAVLGASLMKSSNHEPSALIFLINRSTVDDECCYLRLSVFFPAAKTTAALAYVSAHLPKVRGKRG
jgi:hypothetical protein